MVASRSNAPFTAVQAAQKKTEKGDQALIQFTAVQAAQKTSQSRSKSKTAFTAVQAAQKKQRLLRTAYWLFTAVQAAQKVVTTYNGAGHVHWRIGSLELPNFYAICWHLCALVGTNVHILMALCYYCATTW